MNYLEILNLNQEPFSNTPDPEYFFQSTQHVGCLQKIELSLRLKRGLCVVLGEVGTGKTTLCRQIIRRWASEDNAETHLILDPEFDTPLSFLKYVAGSFMGAEAANTDQEWQLKEDIKNYLFKQGVDKDRTIILIVDEGQKIPEFCLELLREFLNFETNDFKLLQIVIFAQKEFDQTLLAHANFADRINLYHQLEPLNFKDTRALIRFRLNVAGKTGFTPDIFTLSALMAVYRYTGGYPRKIINLCHQCLLTALIQNRLKVDWWLVRTCNRRSQPMPLKKPRVIPATTALLVILLAAALVFALDPKIVPDDPSESGMAIKSMAKPRPTLVAQVAPKKVIAPKAVPKNAEPLLKGPAAQKPEVIKTKQPTPSPDINAAAHVKSAALAAGQDQAGPMKSPVLLGAIEIRSGETLYRLMLRVYGTYKRNHLLSMFKVNPRLKNPDTILVGQALYFPVIVSDFKAPGNQGFWVKFDQSSTLDEAHDLVRILNRKKLKARIIPFWNSQAGLQFSVILVTKFEDEPEARKYIEGLSRETGMDTDLLASWDEGSIYFSNPHFWAR